MTHRFTNTSELLASLAESGLSFPAFVVRRESHSSGADEKTIRDELARRITVTRHSIDRGAGESLSSYSGLTRGSAFKMAAYKNPLVQDELFNKAVLYALAVNEVNACGGKIVAFPTAGSCGIVPGVLWAFRDSRRPDLGPESPEFQDAFIVASAIGTIIAERATLAGAAGGCQAECGAAGAMAAAGLLWLMKQDPRACIDAAALSLKNSLGLACDPVGGLVEVPCVKRNAFLATNALTAATLELAGIESAIPFDEVVSAMKSIGDAMPVQLKESAEGGLAMTPTGIAVKNALLGNKA